MRHPKIAIVAKSMLIGYGVDEIVNFLSKELSRHGYDITVLANKNEYSDRGYKTIAYNVATLPFANEFWNDHFLTDFRSYAPLANILDDYDIIVTVDPMHIVGALAKIRLQKKVIMYYFGVPPPKILDSFERKTESLRQTILWNLSFFFCDCLMSNSLYTRKSLPSYLEKRTIVNYHGIEHLVCHDHEKATKLREELDINDKLLILSVGRFSTPYKGMAEIARIFNAVQKKNHAVVLLLVGRGSIHSLGIRSPMENVKTLSNIPIETLKLCYAACDIYCTCSKWEGFDLPVVAAQANGKPVIAYNVGAHREVVLNEKTGFLVENTSEFLLRLRSLVDDTELRRRIGRRGRIAAQRFTWKESVKRFEKAIDIAYSK
ncbi:MAG: glycosyltransferase family 4 protein [Candidatus Bathyarchaeia archaeon]